MTGAEIVAIISVSVGGLTTLLSTCFHSRCSKIKTPCIECERVVMEEDNNNNNNNENNNN
tara:strand:+ start:455 stop:634 length:180 start_codon:yes stop_codon:yes gene_type:complete